MKMKSMKAMKAMKSMKTMKKAMKAAMKKKAMKKSVVAKLGAKGYKTRSGALRAVFNGKFVKSAGGLKKENLTKNKFGRVVSKKRSTFGKKSKWIAAVQKARTALKVKGFFAIGGKTATGKALLAK